MIARLAFLLIGAFAFSTPADAQIKNPPSPEGAWAFLSDPMPDTCVFSGDMTIRRTSANTYSCAFTGRWACKSGDPTIVDTEQSCTAKQTGSALAIASTVTRIVDAKPPSYLEAMRRSYLADQFTLTIDPGGDNMDGRSWDAVNKAHVRFRRKGVLIS